MTQKERLGEAKVTSRGQITIPVRVMERLGLARGDYLLFLLDEGGHVLVQAAQLKPKPRAGSPSR